MTKASVAVSVKLPARILERIPPPGQGRSGFIVQAIEEKLARRQPTRWKPATARGRRLAALLAKGKRERGPDLTLEEIEAELRARRGTATREDLTRVIQTAVADWRPLVPAADLLRWRSGR